MRVFKLRAYGLQPKVKPKIVRSQPTFSPLLLILSAAAPKPLPVSAITSKLIKAQGRQRRVCFFSGQAWRGRGKLFCLGLLLQSDPQHNLISIQIYCVCKSELHCSPQHRISSIAACRLRRDAVFLPFSRSETSGHGWLIGRGS